MATNSDGTRQTDEQQKLEAELRRRALAAPVTERPKGEPKPETRRG